MEILVESDYYKKSRLLYVINGTTMVLDEMGTESHGQYLPTTDYMNIGSIINLPWISIGPITAHISMH